MAWKIYRSYTSMDFKKHISLTFDFSLGENETFGFGFRERNAVPSIRTIDNFTKNLERNLIFTTNPTIFSLSKVYEYADNLIVKRRVDPDSFFDKATKIVNKKVYEKIDDLSTFDKDKHNDFFVEGDSLYVCYPEKYQLNKDGKIGMVFNKDTMTFVLCSCNNSMFFEQYFIDGTFRGAPKKSRISLYDSAGTLVLSQKDDSFNTALTVNFPIKFDYGYFFAGAEAPNDLNSFMNDLTVIGATN